MLCGLVNLICLAFLDFFILFSKCVLNHVVKMRSLLKNDRLWIKAFTEEQISFKQKTVRLIISLLSRHFAWPCGANDAVELARFANPARRFFVFEYCYFFRDFIYVSTSLTAPLYGLAAKRLVTEKLWLGFLAVGVQKCKATVYNEALNRSITPH